MQPLARDYVPRRSGEIAASLLQAYAVFHHNRYDAGSECFVPANLVLRPPGTLHGEEDTLSCSFLLRRGRVCGGSIFARGFFAGAQAALHFGLQILAQVLRHDAGRG